MILNKFWIKNSFIYIGEEYVFTNKRFAPINNTK